MSPLKIHKNDASGLQIEWRGFLLTLRPNEHHGLAGSITLKDEDGLQSLEFHGKHPEQAFPLEVHTPR